jgi:hypothetical protein
MLARIFLIVNALLFLWAGSFAFLNPEAMALTLGAESFSADGLHELRSSYGGVSIGIALMCLCGGLRDTFQRPALFGLAAYTGGYALGRIAALPFDGIPSSSLIAYGVYEFVVAAIAIVLFKMKSA